MQMKTCLVLVVLMAAAASTHAAISAGQKLQLNFTDGWTDPGNWNSYTIVNSGYNGKTGNDTEMVDSLGTLVTGVSLTATNWYSQNWNGGVAWVGDGVEELTADESANFWWGDGTETNETITISGLDTGLYYNVRLYALNPADAGTGPFTIIDLNGNMRNGARQGDRWNSTTTPFAWNSVVATASGDLEFIIDAQMPDNPAINAIVIEAVTNPPPTSIVAGQWLQINFTDGWYVNAVGLGSPVPHGGGGLRNWNYMNVWSNSSYNASTAGTGLIDSQGNTLPGISLSASGWMGGGWSGGAVWGGNGIETAGPDGLGGNHLMQTDETINFWWGFNSSETVTIHGLDAGLSYNVKLYSINNGGGNAGETTTVALNGITTASFTELERWNSTTTPYAWNGISATSTGDLVFYINSTVNDNPVINAIVIEAAVASVPPEIGNIAVNQLPGTNGLALTWATDTGWDYAVQRKLSLLDENWTYPIAGIAGTGGNVTVTTAVDQVQSYYRAAVGDYIQRPDSKQYLVFELTNIPIWDFDYAVGELVTELGTNNPASSQMYAFGMNAIPLLTRSVWVLNSYVNAVFDVAEAYDVPAYFHIDPLYGFGTDPIPAGEEPTLQYWDHPEMCEWVNFPGVGETNGLIPRVWLDWGSYLRLGLAVPNFESPTLQQFYKSQLEDGILKPIKQRLLALQKEGKGYLFAGLNIGWETRIQNREYQAGQEIIAANTGETMHEWEKAKAGYAALYTKGWDDASLTAEAVVQGISKDRLFYDICADTVHDNMELLAKTAHDYGFYKSQIFSHIVAMTSYYDDAWLNNNVEAPPIWAALNDYCTPGFTLDEYGAAKYDLDEMEAVFDAYGHEFKYGAVETYMFHYPTEAEYRAQLDEFFNNGTTLISVLGAVYGHGAPGPYTMNADQAAAVRDWLNQ